MQVGLGLVLGGLEEGCRSSLPSTHNIHVTKQPRTSASQSAGAGFKGAHLTAPALFRQILASFKINDWGLFGGGGGDGAGGGGEAVQ